jgi:hypothetical protein
MRWGEEPRPEAKEGLANVATKVAGRVARRVAGEGFAAKAGAILWWRGQCLQVTS